MHILLVEDDRTIARHLRDGLRAEHYEVHHADDGQVAYKLMSSNTYDLIICDVMLPKINGLMLIERFRKINQTTPVLFLSAKHSVEDRVRGLRLGGDDYLTKPFSLIELTARVHALLRRAHTFVSVGNTLVGGDLHLDMITREVTRRSEKVELLPKEFLLLEYLLRNTNRILTKPQILTRVWNYRFDPQTNVVDVLVCRLRAKVDRDHETRYIRTVRGLGYVFRTD